MRLSYTSLSHGFLSLVAASSYSRKLPDARGRRLTKVPPRQNRNDLLEASCKNYHSDSQLSPAYFECEVDIGP
jgi:hypothetical protein